MVYYENITVVVLLFYHLITFNFFFRVQKWYNIIQFKKKLNTQGKFMWHLKEKYGHNNYWWLMQIK